MKKLLLGALCLVVGATAFAAEKVIGVSLPGPVGYFIAVRDGMDTQAKKEGLKLEYTDANWDPIKQLSQIEDLVAKKVDVIAVAAADSEAIKGAIAIANEAKIPVIAFTNAIGSDEDGKYDGVVTYVGQNEVKTGALTGKIAKNLLKKDDAKIVLMEGVPGTPPQRNRKKGLTEEIAGTKMEIVYNQTSRWEKERAMKIVEDLIQKNQKMDIIITQDDNSAMGAGMALQEAGLKDKIYVIGLGGSKEGLAAIKDGLIDGTTYMSAVEEGAKTIEAAGKLLKGEKLDPVTPMIQVEVNKENVNNFKGEW